MRKFILLLSILFISTACSNFHMEKRRYNKGFHISFNKRHLKEKGESNEKKFKIADVDTKKSPNVRTKNDSEVLLAETHSANTPEEQKLQSIDKETSNSEKTVAHTVGTAEDAVNQSSITTDTLVGHTDSASDPIESKRTSGLWYFAVFGLIPIMFVAKKRTQTVATWATENVSKAQMAIGGLYALGFSSSFLLGNLWQPIIEEWMLAIPLTLAGSILVADVAKKERKSGTVKKRMSFATVNASSFFGTFAMGAQTTIFQAINPESQSGMETWAAILITLLLVVAMVVAFLGVAMLACNLSCSGYGVLALVVLASGTFLALFLGTWGILGAFRGRARNRDNINTALIVAIVPILIILAITGVAAFL
ncbi:MAG: hypothetical protein P8P74_03720 [Crocinitomicaceae bacterium]|nr:hypothetical protein [Crocinitomicaceae bacterium]